MLCSWLFSPLPVLKKVSPGQKATITTITKNFAFNCFLKGSDDMFIALAELGKYEGTDDQVLIRVESFICMLYNTKQKVNYSTIEKTRWFHFTVVGAEGERLPPTKGNNYDALICNRFPLKKYVSGSLLPHIRRANYQAIIWQRCLSNMIDLPFTTSNGWRQLDYAPVKCLLPSAPSAIIELIECNCKKGCVHMSCKCKKSGLPRSDICGCAKSEIECKNSTEFYKHFEF
jgi:hypothetical protein